MAKLDILNPVHYSELAEALRNGIPAVEDCLNNLRMQVETDGDEEDQYNFLYISFHHYILLREYQKAHNIATSMASLLPSQGDLSWYIGQDLFSKIGNVELALLHVSQGLRKVETDDDFCMRYLNTIRLKSLELAIRASQKTENENSIRYLYDIQFELMTLVNALVLPERLLLDAFQHLADTGHLIWCAESVLNRIWQRFMLLQRDEALYSAELAKVEALLAKVPPLGDSPYPDE